MNFSSHLPVVSFHFHLPLSVSLYTDHFVFLFPFTHYEFLRTLTHYEFLFTLTIISFPLHLPIMSFSAHLPIMSFSNFHLPLWVSLYTHNYEFPFTLTIMNFSVHLPVVSFSTSDTTRYSSIVNWGISTTLTPCTACSRFPPFHRITTSSVG